MPMLQSSTFRFELPDGWIVKAATTPVLCEGPNEEQVAIASYGTGRKPTEDDRGLISQLFERARAIMQNNLDKQGFEPVMRIAEITAPNGQVRLESLVMTRDGEVWVAQFAVAHPSAIVLITYSGPLGSETLAFIRHSVEHIEWLVKADPKRWWRFWK